MKQGFFVVGLVVFVCVGAEHGYATKSGLEPPGTVIRIDVDSLPEPYAEPSTANGAERITRQRGMLPQVPRGFRVTVFAEGLAHPRRLLVDDVGGVYVAESGADTITYIRDRDGDGVGEDVRECSDDFDTPYGMVLRGDDFYVADVDYVWRLPKSWCGESIEPTAMTPEGALGSSWGHSTRNIALSEDGRTLYVAVGSRGNIDEEDEPRATIRAFALQEGGGKYWTYASGLRNPVGLVVRDGVMWTVVNERDGLGDELVPDYLASVDEGDFFGWPYTYLGDIPQPGFYESRPDKPVQEPEVLFRAHSAPLGFAFYDAQAFPEAYRGGAFVALHGSWNAIVPQGYLVAYVPFRDGAPDGSYQVFMTGFRVDKGEVGDSAHVFGRPADVAVAADGSLLVADDTAGVIWRVQWVGDTP